MGWDFAEAISQVAEYLGVKQESKKKQAAPKKKPASKKQPAKKTSSSKKQPADPAEKLEWVDWSDEVVAYWCKSKPPITPEAVKSAGGRLARYYKHLVIALPIHTKMGNICGWVIYNAVGRTLPKFSKNGETQWVKVKVTYGSKSGAIGTVETLREK